jgi:predicted RNA binding protein YcfA (HicA-like mRNA interferase family)
MSDTLPVKVREALRRLRDDGWYIDRQRGSHRQLKHPTKPNVVTVPGHPSKDLPAKTWDSIRHQAGLD